jgi:hypothetical protein
MKDIVETMMKEKEGNAGTAKQASHAEPSTAASEPHPVEDIGSSSNARSFVVDHAHHDNESPFDEMIQAAQTKPSSGQEQESPQATYFERQKVRQENHDDTADSVEYDDNEDEYDDDDSEARQEEYYGYGEKQPENDTKASYDRDAEKQQPDAHTTGNGIGESDMSCDSPAFQCFLRRRSIQMVSFFVLCTA